MEGLKYIVRYTEGKSVSPTGVKEILPLIAVM
jgi:hypothetical protein